MHNVLERLPRVAPAGACRLSKSEQRCCGGEKGEGSERVMRNVFQMSGLSTRLPFL